MALIAGACSGLQCASAAGSLALLCRRARQPSTPHAHAARPSIAMRARIMRSIEVSCLLPCCPAARGRRSIGADKSQVGAAKRVWYVGGGARQMTHASWPAVRVRSSSMQLAQTRSICQSLAVARSVACTPCATTKRYIERLHQSVHVTGADAETADPAPQQYSSVGELAKHNIRPRPHISSVDLRDASSRGTWYAGWGCGGLPRSAAVMSGAGMQARHACRHRPRAQRASKVAAAQGTHACKR